ncbi:MAG: penicillin acylase family protein, partial [Pseudomonadota bacterium]
MKTNFVDGLTAPGEIIVDHWGVAHIYAENEADAFFLQGYNAARDRLWQLDFWRRRGLGLLSEVFGPDYVEYDHGARLFLYRGDMAAEWATYGDEAEAAISNFVRGVNAYISEVRNNPALLPVEFRALSYEPDFWKPSDVVRVRSQGLNYNAPLEVARANTLCNLGADAESLREKLEPEWVLKVPVGSDPCALPEGLLHLYNKAREKVKILGSQNHATSGNPPEGSNNWVIAPSRAATGRPILANDPHRGYSTPSLRYLVHVDSPGLAFAGAGEPFLPGISIGHNGHVAFGFTIHPVDQDDIYVYQLKPDDATSYKYRDGWERI